MGHQPLQSRSMHRWRLDHSHWSRDQNNDRGGTAGYVTFDIGTPKTLILAAKVGISTDAGSTTVYLDAGETTGYAGSASQSSSASSETIKIINLPGVYARYIRLRAYTSQAATPTVKVYQIVGYDIGV